MQDFRSVSRTISRSLGALLVAACSVVLWAQTAPLALVSTAWSPFTNEPGQPRFALDLVEAALGRFGVSAKTTIVSADEFTPSLLGGRFDGSAAAWKDAERERAAVFSQPYLENRLVLVGRHGADVSAKALADLTGKRVALVGGYSYGDVIDKAGPVFVRSQSEEDSLARLLKGEVDYTLMDELVVAVHRQQLSEGVGDAAADWRDLAHHPRAVSSRSGASVPDAESIVSRFNAQLRDMIADRTYHRLLHVDWIQADINGDGVPEIRAANGPDRARRRRSTATRCSRRRSRSPRSRRAGQNGFYVGGTIYSDWASVPARYKSSFSTDPDPRRSTASIFRFTW